MAAHSTIIFEYFTMSIEYEFIHYLGILSFRMHTLFNNISCVKWLGKIYSSRWDKKQR